MRFLFKKFNPFAQKPPDQHNRDGFSDPHSQLDSEGRSRDDPLSPAPFAEASPPSPHRNSSVAQEFSLSDNPTPLIPERFARIVSTLSRGSTITLRLGTYLVSSLLDSARIGTLTSLSVTSGAIENLLLRAQHDANIASSHPDSSCNNDESSLATPTSPATLITSNSLNMVNRAATLAQLFTAASFHLASTSLQTASGMAQDTLHILDAIFGSTESSRALAAIISLVRREFGDGSGIYSLVTGLACFSILQSREWSRTVDEIEMFILWDVVVLDTGETLSQQFPSTSQEPKKTDEDSILAAIPPNAQYRVAIDEVKTKTYNIDVKIPANGSAAADAGSSIHIQLPKGATVLHQEFMPAENEGEDAKYNITFQTTSNYFRERKGTLCKEDESQNSETNGKQHDSDNGLSLSSLAGISNLSQVAGNGSVTAAQFIPDPTAVSIKTRPPSPSLPDNYDDEPPSCINDRRYSFNNPLILENIYNEMQSDDDEDDDDKSSIDDEMTSDDYSENGNEGSLFNGNHPNSDSSLSSATFVDKPIKHTQSFPEYPPKQLHHQFSRRNGLKSSSSSTSINSNKDQIYPGNINRRSLTRLSSMTRISNLASPASSGQLAGRSNSQVSLCTSCPKGKPVTNSSSAASIRSCSVDVPRGPLTASDPFFRESGNTQQQQHTVKRFPPGHITANMAKYMRFATASYGQSFMYVLGMGKYASNYTGDPSHHSEHYAFAHHTGLDLDDIVLSSYSDSAVNDSAGIPLVHFVALDHAAKAVVLTIRGTLGIEDILTDLTCDYETMEWQGAEWKAHGGMLRCAQVLKRRTSRVLTTIKQALETWGPEYGLVICGHSLGGGVGAILGILLSEQNEQGVFVTAPGTSLPAGRRVQCFAYGPPGSISEELRQKTRVLVTTVVYGLDVVPCLSLGVLRDFQSVALAFKNDREGVAHDIRKRFLAQFASRHSPLAVHDADDDYLWNLLKRLRAVMQSEKLVPPGEVYHISTNTVFETHDGKTKRATRIIGKVIVDVQKRFGEPVFGRGIFHHSPVYYERALQTLKMGVCNAPV